MIFTASRFLDAYQIQRLLFAWEIFPRILEKRPKGILRDDVEWWHLEINEN